MVGVSALGILIDILLPDSEMTKYLRSVFGIVIVLVIASPIPAFINGRNGSDFVMGSNTLYTADERFLDYAYGERERIMEERLAVQIFGELHVECRVDIRTKPDKKTPDYAFVDVNSESISDDCKNIDIMKSIGEIVSEKTNLSIDCVEVYCVDQ